jgi:hypothetical protein
MFIKDNITLGSLYGDSDSDNDNDDDYMYDLIAKNRSIRLSDILNSGIDIKKFNLNILTANPGIKITDIIDNLDLPWSLKVFDKDFSPYYTRVNRYAIAQVFKRHEKSDIGILGNLPKSLKREIIKS